MNLLFLSAALAAAPATVIEALDAVVRDGAVVWVSPDGTSLHARDLASGSRRWRVPLGPKADAAVVHELTPGRLFVQAAGQYTTIDVATGKVVATRSAPHGWTFVHRAMGACALRSECALAPVSCDDGRALGPTLQAREERFLETDALGNPGYPTCMLTHEVLAGTDAVTLLLDAGVGDGAVVARDPEGAVAWRRSDLAPAVHVPLGNGAAPDGTLCWVSEQAPSGSLQVHGFACGTGATVFRHDVPLPTAPRYGSSVVGWSAKADAVIVSVPGTTEALGRDGTVRWSAALEPNDLGAVPDLRLAPSPITLQPDRWVALDPGTGALREAHALETDSRVVVSDGTLVVASAGRSSDRGGAAVPAPTTFTFERSERGSVARRGDRVVLRLPGDGWVLGEHRAGERAWLVVAEARDGRPDRLHVLSD